MLTLVAVLVGLAAGFVGARILRRPAATGGAASMGRSVGGAVGTRRELDLPHLQRSVLSEMLRHVRPERGSAAVPSEYRVRLSPSDKATVDQAPGFFRQGLEEALSAAGREHGWDVPTRIRIDLEADPTRKPGAPAVDARGDVPAAPIAAAPIVAAPAAARPPAAARLVRANGPDHRLEATTTIGRGPDRDIQVDDTRVGRHHAVIQRVEGRWTITDEGSSNGTRRNGSRITPTTPITLADGDEIGVGPVTFTFRSGR